jgi:replicative DNA helicase
MMSKPVERRPKLTTQEIDYCLLHMIRDPDLFTYAATLLRPTDFSLASEMRYALVWGAALAAADRNGGKLPDQATESVIAMELVSRNDAAGPDVTPEANQLSQDMLGWIFGFPPDQLNPDYYRPLIRDLIVERTVTRDLSKLVADARDVGRPLDLPEVLEQTAARIRQVEASTSEKAKSLVDDWADYQTRLQTYRGQEMLGLRTGMRQLDERTLGLRGLTVLGAMPNVGKTALVLQLGINVINNNPDACFLLVSLEMGRRDLYARVHCNLAEMDYKTLMFGAKELRGRPGTPFKADQLKRLEAADAWVAANGKRVRVLDRETFGASVTAASILGAIQALKAESGATRALVAIDYLQLLPVPTEVARLGDLEADKHRVRVAQDVVAGTRTDGNTVGDAVLVISEARKPTAGKKVWGSELADLMGSSRLGYAADAVLLYRPMRDEEIPENYAAGNDTLGCGPQLEEQGISPAFLTLAKGRDGMRRGEWPIEYHFERSTFNEVQQRRGRDVRPPFTPANLRLGGASPSSETPRPDLLTALGSY